MNIKVYILKLFFVQANLEGVKPQGIRFHFNLSINCAQDTQSSFRLPHLPNTFFSSHWQTSIHTKREKKRLIAQSVPHTSKRVYRQKAERAEGYPSRNLEMESSFCAIHTYLCDARCTHRFFFSFRYCRSLSLSVFTQ